MKRLIFISAVFLLLVGGTLAFRQIAGDPTPVTAEIPTTDSNGVFLVEMKNKICASESPIHTSYSRTVAETNANQDGQLPAVFLVMLEDGICASLSPISTTSRNAPMPDSKKQSLSIPTPGSAEVEPGGWYVHH